MKRAIVSIGMLLGGMIGLTGIYVGGALGKPIGYGEVDSIIL